METLEFIIYPDGRVKETVTGIIGNSCEEVTKAIEAQLGKVVSQEKTSAYFKEKIEQTSNASNKLQYDNW